jgi:flagellar biosynthetic protein FlhB
MADNAAQERTEAPTPRKLAKAREDGQVARSIELPAAAIVIASVLAMLLAGSWLMGRLTTQFSQAFTVDAKLLAQPAMLPAEFARQLVDGLLTIAPIVVLTAVVAVVASGLTGGWLFTFKSLLPKASKVSPIEGFKRMFGTHAAVELLKAVLKFVLVAGVLWWSIASEIDTLVLLGRQALEPALSMTADLVAKAALWVSLSLAVIAAIDVPWQRRSFMQRMKMTRQEVRDEFKDVEGRPEVKAHIRQRQREMSNARMMQRVRDADVVITNPEHFAVALVYDAQGDKPPIVVARGVDLMAGRIREEASLHGVHLFAAPSLARALYFTTDLEQPIPEPLYLAVAQVIAYVYSLEGARPGRAPAQRPAPEVPAAMRFDARGRRVAAQEVQA